MFELEALKGAGALAGLCEVGPEEALAGVGAVTGTGTVAVTVEEAGGLELEGGLEIGAADGEAGGVGSGAAEETWEVGVTTVAVEVVAVKTALVEELVAGVLVSCTTEDSEVFCVDSEEPSVCTVATWCSDFDKVVWE
jgi:hypothetical protein